MNRIIKNIIYTGVIKNGDSLSECQEDLRIIDDNTFNKAQKIREERTRPHSEIPLNLKGQSLLVGNIYCAHCGNRLTLTTSGGRRKLADGKFENITRARYQCHYNVRHPGECDGQSGYSLKKVDDMVDRIVRIKFAEIAAAPVSEIMGRQHEKEVEIAKNCLDNAKAFLKEQEKEMDDLKAETLKVIRGQSTLNADLLNSLVSETQEKISKAQLEVDAADRSYLQLIESSQSLRDEYDQLLSWADLYAKSSFETKKMIVSQFIKAVRVSRNYQLEIDFNVSFEEFQKYSCLNKTRMSKKGA